MEISFDPEKSERNRLERGLPFDWAEQFDFETALYWQDERKPYPEARIVALGYLAGRLHVMVFSPSPAGIRVISLRKANRREGVQHGFPLTRGG